MKKLKLPVAAKIFYMLVSCFVKKIVTHADSHFLHKWSWLLHVALWKQPNFHCFPRKMTSVEWIQNFHTDDVSQFWLVLLVGWSNFWPIRNTTQFLTVTHCVEFLSSFLRYHFAGKLLAWWHGKKSAAFSDFVTVGMFSLDKDIVFDGRLVSCHLPR